MIQGNKHFESREYSEAIECYLSALSLGPGDDKEFHRNLLTNMAFAHLKQVEITYHKAPSLFYQLKNSDSGQGNVSPSRIVLLSSD